jgi:DNA polymerase-3 subunit delta'
LPVLKASSQADSQRLVRLVRLADIRPRRYTARMPFSNLVGNETISQMLRRAVSERRIGQGLIMAGPAGVGKYQFALALAQALNCSHLTDGDACGTCSTCLRIAAGEHLDVRTYAPDGQFIKIGQMRELSEEAQFRPYEGARRVLIIDEADRLREGAANSILKTLEEPPDTTLLILVTSKPYSLLVTIRSRCQLLSFARLSTPELESHLKASQKRPGEEIRLLARLSEGSVGRALEIDLGVYREQRDFMLKVLEASVLRHDTVHLMNSAEHLGRKLERDDFVAHIDSLMTVLSDLFHLRLGDHPESLVNADIADRLEPLAEVMTTNQIGGWVEQMETILQGLPRNISRQLATEAALLALSPE